MTRRWMVQTRLIGTIAVGLCAVGALALENAWAQSSLGYELALVGLDGDKQVLGALPESVFAPRVSPDGREVVFELLEVGDSPSARLWVAELSNLDARRALPSVVGPINFAALWSIDGRRLVFVAPSAEGDAIYWRPADGSGEAEHLIDGRSEEAWTPDGSHLTFLTLQPPSDYGIALLDMQTRAATTWLDLSGSAQHSSSVSPDGEWIAYASNETGRYEVWVAPLSDPSTRHRVTQAGGAHPLWSPDGTTLYYDAESRLYAIDVMGTEGLAIGEPAPLPVQGFTQGEYRRQFDLMPDGRRFLMLFAAPER